MKRFWKLMICFYYFWKKMYFVFGMAHGDPIFAQVGPKNGSEGLANFFRTSRFQWKFLTELIEFPNIFHWKPAKKSVGVILGQNLGQIRSNVVKKVKKQALSLGVFSYFTWRIIPFCWKSTWVEIYGNYS